jgi:tetratricopeptide (TPR) repeat protein
MVGFLGLVGVAVDAFSGKSIRVGLAIFAILIIGIFGTRTAIRGFDWHDPVTLAYANIKASPSDFSSENVIAIDLAKRGLLAEAKAHAQKSISLYPNYNSYNTLGQILSSQGDCSGAKIAFTYVLQHEDYYLTHENMAALDIRCDDPDAQQFISRSLDKFPHDAILWLYSAILEYKNGDSAAAKNAVSRAYTYAQTNEVATIRDKILNNLPLTITYPGSHTVTYPAPQ